MSFDSVNISRDNFNLLYTFYTQPFNSSIKKKGCIPKDILLDSAMFRAKRMIREYSFNNNWSYFITITINKNNFDRYNNKELIIKRITKYFNNYRNAIDNSFRYLLVPELHEDGALHFHGYVVMKDTSLLKFLYYDSLKKHAVYTHKTILKKFGATRFVKIYSNSIASCNYVLKYINKSSDKILSRWYYASYGLNKSNKLMTSNCPHTSASFRYVLDLLNIKKYMFDFGVRYYIPFEKENLVKSLTFKELLNNVDYIDPYIIF